MSVAFRTVSSFSGTASSPIFAMNSARVAGDIILLSVATNTATTISCSTSGWGQIGTTQTWASGTKSSAVFWKVATGSEGNPTVNFGASVAYQVLVGYYFGADQASPINTYAFSNDSDASSTSITAPALTTDSPARVLTFAHTSTQNMSAPTNFIERTEGSTGPRHQLCDIGPDYAAGSLGPWTITIGSAEQHAAWAIALKEDPVRREPAWEASLSGSGTSSSVAAANVSPIQTGDLMVFELETLSSVTVTVVPTGWTLIDATTSGGLTLRSYWKTYNGSYGTFTLSGSGVIRYVNNRFTSPNSGTPVGVVAAGSGVAGTTVTFPALTPDSDGLIVYIGSSYNTSSLTNNATTPTGATERWDVGSTAGTHIFGGTNGLATDGVATSTFTSTLTNSADWAAQTMVLASVPDPAEYERFAPDAIISMSGLTGVVANIQDDPDSADGSWLTV